MNPTNKLRFNSALTNGERRSITINSPKKYYEPVKTYLVLEQWWEEKSGEGEWREIPVVHEYNETEK